MTQHKPVGRVLATCADSISAEMLNGQHLQRGDALYCAATVSELSDNNDQLFADNETLKAALKERNMNDSTVTFVVKLLQENERLRAAITDPTLLEFISTDPFIEVPNDK